MLLQVAPGNYSTSGDPYKTSTHLTTVVNGVETTTVTRQQAGLPAHTETRTDDGSTVTVIKGSGEEAIIHTWENSYPEVGFLQIVETLRKGSADASPTSCSCEQRKLTVGGWLTISRTEGYSTALARTTTYDYNALVAAQSRNTEEFIAADGTTAFEQESIWNGENWLLLSTTAYEYDEQQRVVKTTHGNGRFSTATWMCCGRLSETNEDGITTAYGYNSAHQLVEMIREEVKDGDVIVTPETITTYTRDAAGVRTLSYNAYGEQESDSLAADNVTLLITDRVCLQIAALDLTRSAHPTHGIPTAGNSLCFTPVVPWYSDELNNYVTL